MTAPRGPRRVLRRRDDVRVRHGRGVRPARHQAADVRHVHEHVGADLVADLADLGPVYEARVGRGPGDYHLRPELERHPAHLVVVYEFRIFVHAVAVDVEVFARYRGAGAVRQVAAAGEVHAHQRVARLHQGQVDRNVRLGARVRLHVRVLRAEELAGPPAADLLDLVHIFAAAVEAAAGVALGVFVGQVAAHSLHHRRGGEVLRCDELDMVPLPLQLPLHGGKYFRVLAAQVFIVHLKTAPRPIFFPLHAQHKDNPL